MPKPFNDLRRQLIPDDENGQVLRQMLDDGDDLDAVRPVEFFHVFAQQAQAEAFAAAVAARDDVAVDAPEVDDEGVWQVCVVREMAPAHAALGALERELGQLAEAHGGYPDGWGCAPAEPRH